MGTQHASGQEGGNLLEPFVWGHLGGKLIGRHARAPCRCAHSSLRFASGLPSGGNNECLLLTYPVGIRSVGQRPRIACQARGFGSVDRHNLFSPPSRGPRPSERLETPASTTPRINVAVVHQVAGGGGAGEDKVSGWPVSRCVLQASNSRTGALVIRSGGMMMSSPGRTPAPS